MPVDLGALLMWASVYDGFGTVSVFSASVRFGPGPFWGSINSAGLTQPWGVGGSPGALEGSWATRAHTLTLI